MFVQFVSFPKKVCYFCSTFYFRENYLVEPFFRFWRADWSGGHHPRLRSQARGSKRNFVSENIQALLPKEGASAKVRLGKCPALPVPPYKTKQRLTGHGFGCLGAWRGEGNRDGLGSGLKERRLAEADLSSPSRNATACAKVNNF